MIGFPVLRANFKSEGRFCKGYWKLKMFKIDQDKLGTLIQSLKDDLPRSAPVICKVKQYQRTTGQLINIQVYVDSWPSPQIVILENLSFKRKDLFKFQPVLVYTRDISTEQIYKIFTTTPLLKRMCQEGYSEFEDTEYRIVQIVKDICQHHGFQVDVYACPFIYTLTDQAKSSCTFHQCPTGYQVTPLQHKDADYINRNWKFGGKCALKRLQIWIKYSFAVGAVCLVTNELVSWGLVSEAGCISAVNTIEGHQRKGLAKTVVSELIRRVQNEGMFPFVYIEETNSLSQNLFEKLGFTKCQEGQLAFFSVI